MSWVETQRPGVDGINIITSDFVELTDFANIVIRLNNLLLSETENRARWHKEAWKTDVLAGQCVWGRTLDC